MRVVSVVVVNEVGQVAAAVGVVVVVVVLVIAPPVAGERRHGKTTSRAPRPTTPTPLGTRWGNNGPPNVMARPLCSDLDLDDELDMAMRLLEEEILLERCRGRRQVEGRVKSGQMLAGGEKRREEDHTRQTARSYP